MGPGQISDVEHDRLGLGGHGHQAIPARPVHEVVPVGELGSLRGYGPVGVGVGECRLGQVLQVAGKKASASGSYDSIWVPMKVYYRKSAIGLEGVLQRRWRKGQYLSKCHRPRDHPEAMDFSCDWVASPSSGVTLVHGRQPASGSAIRRYQRVATLLLPMWEMACVPVPRTHRSPVGPDRRHAWETERRQTGVVDR
jgi:hypothetical protein